ncbi:MAG: hypothetical protein Q4P13_09350 [Psychrobacter sp.]|nr:hypothetical protein [Psychrobacter sp.]
MAQAAGQHDYGGMAKAYSTGVAASVVGDVVFTALAGIDIAGGGGVLVIGAATGIGLAAAWGIGTTIDLINCELEMPYPPDPTKPFTPDPNDPNSGDKSYRIEYYDPIILDLNSDGIIQTIDDNGYFGALFDHDGDGIRTSTAWVDTSG